MKVLDAEEMMKWARKSRELEDRPGSVSSTLGLQVQSFFFLPRLSTAKRPADRLQKVEAFYMPIFEEFAARMPNDLNFITEFAEPKNPKSKRGGNGFGVATCNSHSYGNRGPEARADSQAWRITAGS
jgi:hypothetical protein